MRALWWAALLAGISYCLVPWLRIEGAWTVAWKGAGVALLAGWALGEGRRWIAAVLALGALGDVLLDLFGLTPGAVAFLAGHVLAAVYYVRNARRPVAPWVPLLILIAVPAAAFGLSGQPGVALYAAGLGAMGASAWASRFARDRVALGALLFVGSDMLIFAPRGPLSAAIWPLYFVGQALIAWGVVRGSSASRGSSGWRGTSRPA